MALIPQDPNDVVLIQMTRAQAHAAMVAVHTNALLVSEDRDTLRGACAALCRSMGYTNEQTGLTLRSIDQRAG